MPPISPVSASEFSVPEVSVPEVATPEVPDAEVADAEIPDSKVGPATAQMSLALNDLGRALLPGNMQVAVACLLHAEALARAIGHPMSEEIASFVSKLRPDDVAVDEFAAVVAELAAHAEAIVAVLFAQSAAAMAAGELDLYAPPPAQGAHDAG